MSFFNVIRIPRNRLSIYYLTQQTAQSVINNHLYFMMFLLQVLASTHKATYRPKPVVGYIINDKCLFVADCVQIVGLNTAFISECYIL
jgi:hypothetical protein